MVHSGYDFQSDLVACYSHIRKRKAMQFDGFDPMAILNQDENCTDKELILHKRKVDVMEKQQREGYNRIRVKVKDLRSGYKSSR